MSTVVTSDVQDSGGSSLLGRRNAIINGNFGVNQRGVSGTVSLSAGEYGHDRWKAGASGATYTFSTSGGVTTIDISAGSLIQIVEDVNVVTDTYVLSFEGTAQGKIGGGSFGDSGVTESVTGGSNLNIEFGTGTVSKVQLEVGNKPTPFEHRSYGEELALCQRYYQDQSDNGSSLQDIPVTHYDTNAFWQHLIAPMRVAPSVNYTVTNYFEAGSSHTFGSVSTTNITEKYFEVALLNVGGTNGNAGLVYFKYELDAEL